MNLLHFFFGIGAITAPILIIIFRNFSWRYVFLIVALFPLLVAIILYNKDISVKQNDNEKQNQIIIYKQPILWLCGFIMFFYVGLEVSIYGWLPTYWEQTAVNSIIAAPLTATIFWSSLTAGRLLIGKLADHFGYVKYLLLTVLILCTSSFIWWLLPGQITTLMIALLLGFSLAGIFPIVMLLANESFQGNSGKVTAFVNIFVALGGLLIPAYIGRLADSFQIRILPITIFLLTCLLLIIVFFTNNYQKNLLK